jgi:diguanylate cyclase (GGDEF)-like protein/PAS domain S-box-containing protein
MVKRQIVTTIFGIAGLSLWLSIGSLSLLYLLLPTPIASLHPIVTTEINEIVAPWRYARGFSFPQRFPLSIEAVVLFWTMISSCGWHYFVDRFGVREKTAAALESGNEAIARFRPDLSLIHANGVYCRGFGKTPRETIGHLFTAFIFPEDRQRALDTLAALTPETPRGSSEHRIVAGDSEIKWFSWQYEAMFNDKNEVIEYRVKGREITEKKAEIDNELARRVEECTERLREEREERRAIEDDLNQKNEIIEKILANVPVSVALFDGDREVPLIDRQETSEPENLATAWTYLPLSNGKTLGIGRDASERERVLVFPPESEERFWRAIVHSPLPTMLHAEDGEVIAINRVWTQLTGYEHRDIPTIELWTEKAYGEKKAPVQAGIGSVVPAEPDRLYQLNDKIREGEFVIRAKNGRYRIWDFSSAPLGRLPDGRRTVLSMALDVTERVSAEERLRHNSRHDALTGLPNRVMLMERVEEAVQRARLDPNYRFAVLFIDLDRFKTINDSLGHLVGDRLLMALAEKLRERVTGKNAIARLGGDEFIALADRLQNYQEAIDLAEDIARELQTSFSIEGQEFYLSASIGIAFNTDANQMGTDILRNADLAMYEAKARGKARHAVFDPAMHRRANRLWELETNLRRALEKYTESASTPSGEFVVHYQPIVSLVDGKLMGFEALARWFHPSHGPISPAEFIPVAEETGLIVPLGCWILQEACAQLQRWREEFGLGDGVKMSVNLSSAQIQQTDLIEQIDRILETTGLDGDCLKLEITESILMENTEIANDILSRLRARRIGISIDDFGTGYSSLSYLHRLPVDTLKIDRSFVRRMNEDRENRGIVEAVITLARHLGMNVVAEGIETREQLDRLTSLHCGYGQGYFFAKPLDRAAIGAYLRGSVGSGVEE